MNNSELLAIARSAAQDAYAPYSSFRVGAAVLLDSGEVVTGNNQENISYSLSMCAERVAVNYVFAQYPSAKIIAVAIAGISTDDLVTPCGACCQVLAEVKKRQESDFFVVMYGKYEGMLVKNISDLLPYAFNSNFI